MVPRIRNLPSTTFGGEPLSRRASAELHETVQFCSAPSRGDLVQTACEQMDWTMPDRATRLSFGLHRLGVLARRGVVRLSPKRSPGLPPELDGCTALQPPLRAKFSHSLSAVEQELEALFPQAQYRWAPLNRVIEHAARGPQRVRPGRSYPRRSRRPSKNGGSASPPIPPPQTESHLFAANRAVPKTNAIDP